jgi:hypothetical protein
VHPRKKAYRGFGKGLRDKERLLNALWDAGMTIAAHPFDEFSSHIERLVMRAFHLSVR